MHEANSLLTGNTITCIGNALKYPQKIRDYQKEKGGGMVTTSNFLLKLYRGAVDLPANMFKDWALDEAQRVIRFDSSVWGAGCNVEASQPTIHSIHLYRIDSSFMASWFEHYTEDTLIRKMAQNPGRTVSVNASKEFRGLEIYEKHCKRFGMEHLLGTMDIDSDTQLLNAIGLYRKNPQDPFTEEERLLNEELFPHLIEALRLNWLSNLPHLYSAVQKSSFNSLAACNAEGLLQMAMPSFVEAVRQEWPQWRGPLLPPPVTEAILAEAPKYVGKKAVVGFHTMSDLILLRIRSRVPADDLSSRELEIARFFADGADYKTVAQSLSLSPSTVRNHLNNIYFKLDINDKTNLVSELAKLV